MEVVTAKLDHMSVATVQVRGPAGRITAAVDEGRGLKIYVAQLVLWNNLLGFMTVKVFEGFQFFD